MNKPPMIRKTSKMPFVWGGTITVVLVAFVGLVTARRPPERSKAEENHQMRVALTNMAREDAAKRSAPQPAKPARQPDKYEIAAKEKVEAVLGLEMVNPSWRKDGFGSVMIGTFAVANRSRFDVKDLTIVVTESGNSGTALRKTTHTVYETIPAGDSKHIDEMNLGFIHPQTQKAGFHIVDCVVIGASAAVARAEQTERVMALQRKDAQEAEVQRRFETAGKVLKYQTEQAEKGLPSFQFELGRRYLKGDGVTQDVAQARTWFTKAAAQGDLAAQKALAELK